jgi:hypothetical protein
MGHEKARIANVWSRKKKKLQHEFEKQEIFHLSTKIKKFK